ncbi:MAG: hypothetical protein AB7K52_11920 [Phycisphaerales bacterium]
MSTADRSSPFDSLLEKLRKQRGGKAASVDLPVIAWCADDRVLSTFIASFMLWDAPIARAATALEALGASVIDANDLRVSLPEELLAIIGRSYPRGQERMTRLCAALNDVYRREHAVRLAHLKEKSKREARAYLESLAHTPPFVAGRTFLLALEGHAVPVDERLLGRLLEIDAVGDESATPESMSVAFERAIRAGSAAEAHALLTSWADEPPNPTPSASRRSRSTRKAAAAGNGERKARQPVASAKKRSPARRTRRR